MAKIPPKLMKVFADALSAPDNIATFGSTAAGAPTYSKDLDMIQTAAWVQGWAGATQGDASPVMQDDVGVNFAITTMIAYIQQMGVCEWLPTKTYFIGSWVQNPAAPGVPYISLTDSNFGNPVGDTNNWISLPDMIRAAVINSKQLIKKFCSFNGQGTPAFYSKLGVSSVARLGVGNYMLTFDPPFTGNLYVATTGITQENAAAALVMNTRFPGDTKTETQYQVRTVSCFDSSGFDCPEVSLQFTDES